MRYKKLTRRGFLGTTAGAGLGGLALRAFPVEGLPEGRAVSEFPISRHDWTPPGADTSHECARGAEDWKSTSDQPPRKVIVGTVMQPFWGEHPGLERRLEQLTEIVDRLQAQSQKQYGRGLDLAVLPEKARSTVPTWSDAPKT